MGHSAFSFIKSQLYMNMLKYQLHRCLITKEVSVNLYKINVLIGYLPKTSESTQIEVISQKKEETERT